MATSIRRYMKTPEGNFQWVDILKTAYVELTGSIMTGPITYSFDPTDDNHLVRRKYVTDQIALQSTADSSAYVNTNGDTMTGALVVLAPAAPNHAATMGYVDTQVAPKLNRAGDTMGGPLTLVADPITALQPATKQYVDSRWEPGDIKQTVRVTATAGWLMLNGQTILNADTLYPALWAVVPAAWKSGTTLTLPDMAGRTTFGGGGYGPGGVSGASTHTLTVAQLPSHEHNLASHTHTMPHVHGMSSHYHTLAHSHTIGHDHANATAANAHALAEAFWSTVAGNFSVSGVNGNASVGATGLHSHTVNIPTFSGSSGGASDTTSTGPSTANTEQASDYSTTASLPNTSNSTGSGASVDHMPPHLRINFMIKT